MSAALTLAPERQSFFRDHDGFHSVAKFEDDVKTYTVNWARKLGSDTISSQTVSADGPTVDSSSNTTTTSTLTLSKGSGCVTIKVTTSASETHELKLRVYTIDEDDERRRY